jgi:hypothetical protein
MTGHTIGLKLPPAGKFFEVRPPNSGNHQYPKSAPLSKLGT